MAPPTERPRAEGPGAESRDAAKHQDQPKDTTFQGPNATNLVWQVQARKSHWSPSTATTSRVFAARRPAMAMVERLIADGYDRIQLSYARRGTWHAVDVDVPRAMATTTGCAACGGTGRLLADVPDLSRRCPCCALVSAC